MIASNRSLFLEQYFTHDEAKNDVRRKYKA